MAWRGSIAFSKGLGVRNKFQSMRDDRVEKWRNFFKQSTLRAQQSRAEHSIDTADPFRGHLDSQVIHTDQEQARVQTLTNSHQNRAELNRMNSWNNGRLDASRDSGLSDISSSLDQHKNPSHREVNRYDDFTIRREIYFAKENQPQDADEDDGLQLSFAPNGSQRRLVQDYELRKQESLAQEKRLKELIMLRISQGKGGKLGVEDLHTHKTMVPFELATENSELTDTPTNEKPARQSFCCRQKFMFRRLKILNLSLTVPLRGRLSICQAVTILIINLVLPGVGTAILACYISEKMYISETATLATQAQKSDRESEELANNLKIQASRYRRKAVITGLLQFLALILFLAGWFWALSLSIMLVSDAITYGGKRQKS